MAGTLSGMGPEPGRPRAGATRRKPFPPPPFAPFGNGSDAVAQVRLAMQKIKDVLRLHLAGGVTSRRQLALVVGCGKTAVSDCLRRAQVAGLTDWPAVAALDEGELGPPQATIRLTVAATCGSRIASGLALPLLKRRYAACVLAQSPHSSLIGERGDFPSSSAVFIKRRSRRLSPRSTPVNSSRSHSTDPVPASIIACTSGSSLRDLFRAPPKHPPHYSATRGRLPDRLLCVQPSLRT